MLNQGRASWLARCCNTTHVLMSKLLFLHILVKIVEHFWLFLTKIFHIAALEMLHLWHKLHSCHAASFNSCCIVYNQGRLQDRRSEYYKAEATRKLSPTFTDFFWKHWAERFASWHQFRYLNKAVGSVSRTRPMPVTSWLKLELLNQLWVRSINWEPEQKQGVIQEPDQQTSTASGLPQAQSLGQCEPVMIWAGEPVTSRFGADFWLCHDPLSAPAPLLSLGSCVGV